MEHARKLKVPDVVDSVEKFLDNYLQSGGTSVHIITKDGCYPTTKDVEEDLYQRAIHIGYSAMGWKVPTEWRQWYGEALTNLGIKAPTIDEFNNFMPTARHCNRTLTPEDIGNATPKRQRESPMNMSINLSQP